MMDKDTFSFLITTDNHMGFKEDDHIRRKDSYMAFKEALKVAREKDVDFILLGGDLFHMNRPSPSIEHKCIKIIRQHMNAPASRGTSFKRIKGQFSHFHKLNHPNFEDLNLTVPYPILTIHGNHDDPTGPNAQSVCVKLATCGLLNYFGALKPNVRSIIIEPIILQKKNVKIALYGLGFISDLKLKQAFDNGEVVFLEPPPDSYNILVVHQNRIPYNKAKYIPDDMFPLNFHLIIRGHEHDAQEPESIPDSEVNGLVYQPGSTVATSISSYEAIPKKVGIFSIGLNSKNYNGDIKNQFNVNYELIELSCCRRMIVKDIPQKEIFSFIKEKLGTRVTSTDFKRLSREYVVNCLEKLLEQQRVNDKKVNSDSYDVTDNDQKVKSRLALPLMRVRLEYSVKSERFDTLDVTALFYPNRVANKDIVYYKKQKLVMNENGEMINKTFADCSDNNNKNEIDDEDEDYDEFDHINLGEEKRDIDIMIESYFKDKSPSDRLQALSLSEYTNAVRGTGEDGNVISKVLNTKKQEILNKYTRYIKNDKVTENFMNEDDVRKWFLEAFSKDLDVIQMSGDEFENNINNNGKNGEIMLDGEENFDDDSMDVVVCN